MWQRQEAHSRVGLSRTEFRISGTRGHRRTGVNGQQERAAEEAGLSGRLPVWIAVTVAVTVIVTNDVFTREVFDRTPAFWMNDDSRSRRPPIVGMDNNRRGRRVDIALVDAPANVVPACDGSRGAHCGERQKAGTRASCHESSSHWRHFHSQLIHIFLLLWASSFCSSPRRKRPQTSLCFRGRTLKLPLMGKVTRAKKHFTRAPGA
jgi:hypothetical protein